MDIKTVVRDYWAVLSTAGLGLIAVTTLNADVSQLKEDAKDAKADSKTIIEIRTEQRQMQKDIEEIKETLKEIARSART